MQGKTENCKLIMFKQNIIEYHIIYIIFFLLTVICFSSPVLADEKKYHQGDGFFVFDDGKTNSGGSILLLTEIYCERNNLNFTELYTTAYPGADTSWIKDLKKEYTSFTSIPDKIDVDLLIEELINIEYAGLADELCYRVYGYGIYEENYGYTEERSNWALYLSIGGFVIALLLLFRYKARIRWTWRKLRKSSYKMETVEGCLKALEDKDELVRGAAVEALGKIGDNKAVEALMNVMEKEKDVWVRKSVILQLGDLKVKRAIPLLIKSLEDNTGFIVSASAHALTLIGDTKALEPIKERLKTIKSTAATRDLRNALQKLEKLEKNRRK